MIPHGFITLTTPAGKAKHVKAEQVLSLEVSLNAAYTTVKLITGHGFPVKETEQEILEMVERVVNYTEKEKK